MFIPVSGTSLDCKLWWQDPQSAIKLPGNSVVTFMLFGQFSVPSHVTVQPWRQRQPRPNILKMYKCRKSETPAFLLGVCAGGGDMRLTTPPWWRLCVTSEKSLFGSKHPVSQGGTGRVAQTIWGNYWPESPCRSRTLDKSTVLRWGHQWHNIRQRIFWYMASARGLIDPVLYNESLPKEV